MYKKYFVYILTNQYNNVLYVGVTNNISRRLGEHKEMASHKSFTAIYRLKKLVFYEVYNDIRHAISREKQIKGGSRKDKIDLINKENKLWNDLGKELLW